MTSSCNATFCGARRPMHHAMVSRVSNPQPTSVIHGNIQRVAQLVWTTTTPVPAS